jgi:hypothetical protein
VKSHDSFGQNTAEAKTSLRPDRRTHPELNLHSDAQKGPEGPSHDCILLTTHRIPVDVSIAKTVLRCALGRDDCILLTKGSHWVRFPAGTPHPRVGLLMAGHYRHGSPTLRD